MEETSKIKHLKIPTHSDPRGNLSAIELKDYINWIPKRIYYVTSATLDRGGHAVRGEKKIYVCMQGSIEVRIHDGKKWHEFEMKGPEDALQMDEMCFREFKNFSAGAVLMAVSSMNYEKEQYIYDFDQFLKEAY